MSSFSIAMQKDALTHESAMSDPVTPTGVVELHVPAEYVRERPVSSRAMQNVAEGHDTAMRTFPESMIIGVLQEEPL